MAEYQSTVRESQTAAEAVRFVAPLLIGGKSPQISPDACFLRSGPLSTIPVTRAASATPDDVEAAAVAAARAFADWSRTASSQRRDILLAAAEQLVRSTGPVAQVMMAETGATRQWCEFNVELAARILHEAADLAGEVDPDLQLLARGAKTSFSIRQSAGVCLAMAAWNAPILLAVRSFAYALAWGNTVIFKSSELCPATQRMLGNIMQEAGLPDGVLNILSNSPDEAGRVVESLIAHPVVRRINFTGSTRVGRTIAQIAAKHLKRCLLELGGKAPLIVLADADLEEAAKAASFGAFFNQGQICMSTERIIVEDTVADELVERLTERAERLRAGDPVMDRMALGSLISAEAGVRLNALVEDARARGAKIRCGGLAYGSLMDATVIDHVDSSMRLYREESFGPLVSIIRVADADEAVSVANDCEYGLSGSVFSRDIKRAMRVAMQVETGILHINSATVADDPAMPFGGMRGSGYGRIGGKSAVDEFTELRWITVNQTPAHYPL